MAYRIRVTATYGYLDKANDVSNAANRIHGAPQVLTAVLKPTAQAS
jgi:hypothetical protein